MPRIAAAFAVVVLIALSIGINTRRYPVVWEMVGGPVESAPSDEPSQPASADQSLEISPPAERERYWAGPIEQYSSGSSPEAGDGFCDGYTCSIGSGPREPTDTSGNEDPWAVEDADATSAYAASLDETPYDTPAARREMIPIVPTEPAVAQRVAADDANESVRRLPSPDRVRPDWGSPDTSHASTGASPVYPSTGI